MGFASAYLDERALFPPFIEEAPLKDTGIIIVVPAYDEPGISFLLDSLSHCGRPSCSVEVIIVINAPCDSTEQSIRNNQITYDNIKLWMRLHPGSFLRIFPVVTARGVYPKWGVGMARKCGMDEAIRRFDTIDRPGGIILNLDADCGVAGNYLTRVYDSFAEKPDRSACSIYFEHPLQGDDFPPVVYSYIALYELHLRYFYQAMVSCGYPFAFHTVGSATAVKALPYVRAGGMNRKQAGEDFHFIQKLIPAGGYFSLNATTVFPSPRPSLRVPFGTGASVAKMASAGKPDLQTYNLDAFRELRSFFSMRERLHACTSAGLHEIYQSLSPGLRSFVNEAELTVRINEIRSNTSGFPAFSKRFFGWFNMFRIVKYLNHVHQGVFMKTGIAESARKLLMEKGIEPTSPDVVALLMQYRSMERFS